LALADLGVFYAVGFALVVAGVALIVAALIRASTRQQSEKDEGEGESHVRGAGVIMIGPIPIIFGTDKKSVKTVLALALALSIVFLIILIIYYGLLG
jgi:Predicted membrane protein